MEMIDHLQYPSPRNQCHDLEMLEPYPNGSITYEKESSQAYTLGYQTCRWSAKVKNQRGRPPFSEVFELEGWEVAL